MVIECAYGYLKGQWRVLLRKSESSKEQVCMTALACMILHNVCIMQGHDAISKKLDLTIEPENNEKRYRAEVRKLLQMRECKSIRDVSKEANSIRNALTIKLWTEKETGIVS